MKRKSDQSLEDSDDQASKDEGKGKRRKHDPEYISFGFTALGTDADRPRCVVCLQIISNDAMKPAKLRRHFTTMHSELASKPKKYFERQKALYLKQEGKLMVCHTVNKKALRASFSVALRIVRSKKPHTIAEELILPAPVGMCEVVLGKEYSQKLKAIPLSDKTMSRQIADIYEDVRC